MGQRHQAFVIARLLPKDGTKAYYRCIASVHHQWCYGSLPLRAARRFLTLVKQKVNAEIISDELRLLQGEYGRKGEKPRMPDVPSIYISFLLASAWNIGLDNPLEPYISGVTINRTLLSANMGSHDGDNNDGITIIDVTDPTKPAYCFVHGSSPLDATDYIRGYYPEPKRKRESISAENDNADEDDENDEDDDDESDDDDDESDEGQEESFVLETIAALDGEPLVTLDMLAEAWPREYTQALKKKEAASKTASEEAAPVVEEPTNQVIPSLAELSLKPAIEHSLIFGDTEELEQLVWLPGKAAAMIAHLKSANPFPDSGLSLLAKALGQDNADHAVDLSHFSLSTKQITTLLENRERVDVLKLSHNPLVTIDTVREVLTSVPNLKHLVLLNTSVMDQDLSDLLSTNQELFIRLETLVHPLFHKSKKHPVSFSFTCYVYGIQGCVTAGLPIFTPAQVLQNLAVYLKPFAQEKTDVSFTLNMGLTYATLFPHAVFSTRLDALGQPWGARAVPFVARSAGNGFEGEGWIFAFRWDRGTSPGDRLYGFLKPELPLPEDKKVFPTFQVYDLPGFLAATEKEGRPAPPGDVVVACAAALNTLCTDEGLALMTVDAIPSYVEMLNRSILFKVR